MIVLVLEMKGMMFLFCPAQFRAHPGKCAQIREPDLIAEPEQLVNWRVTTKKDKSKGWNAYKIYQIFDSCGP